MYDAGVQFVVRSVDDDGDGDDDDDDDAGDAGDDDDDDVCQVSVIVDKKVLMLHMLFDIDNPVSLTFREEYGHIVTYQWSV